MDSTCVRGGQVNGPAASELWEFVRQNGIAPFIVTGRQEKREFTAGNLREAGFTGWADLIMQPDGSSEPARVFKPRRRQAISNKGYRIILNIGDQASDLAGCCAERVFKLANPFYLVP